MKQLSQAELEQVAGGDNFPYPSFPPYPMPPPDPAGPWPINDQQQV